jgi:hypothetical protein
MLGSWAPVPRRYVSLTGMRQGRQNTRWMIDLNVKMYAPWIPLTAALHWCARPCSERFHDTNRSRG